MGMRLNAEKVRDLMWERRIGSQAELARRAKISPVTLVSILKGGSFTLDTLEKVAGVLEVNPLDLLLAEGYPAPQPPAPAFPATPG